MWPILDSCTVHHRKWGDGHHFQQKGSFLREGAVALLDDSASLTWPHQHNGVHAVRVSMRLCRSMTASMPISWYLSLSCPSGYHHGLSQYRCLQKVAILGALSQVLSFPRREFTRFTLHCSLCRVLLASSCSLAASGSSSARFRSSPHSRPSDRLWKGAHPEVGSNLEFRTEQKKTNTLWHVALVGLHLVQSGWRVTVAAETKTR